MCVVRIHVCFIVLIEYCEPVMVIGTFKNAYLFSV